MKEVQFHHGMGDKLAYACRLVRKARQADLDVVVTGDAHTLRQFDRQLWVFDELAFLPHVLTLSGQAVPSHLQDTPVWLTDDPAHTPRQPQVLINLGSEMPDGIDAFQRFFDVVSIDPADRQAGRQRWRTYESRGWAVKAHAAQE